MTSAPAVAILTSLIGLTLAAGVSAQPATANPPVSDVLPDGRIRLRPVAQMDDGSRVPAGVRYRLDGPVGINTTGVLDAPSPPSGPLPFGFTAVARRPVTVVVGPGSGWFFLRPPYGFEVQSASFNGIDLLRQPLEVTTADDGRTIDIVLTRDGSKTTARATVNGTIGDHPRLDLALIDVTAPLRRTAALVKTDDGGRFVVEGVEPGVYDLEMPPLRTVLTRIVVPPADVRVDVPAPPGARLFGGVALVYSSSSGPLSRGPLTLVADRDGTQDRIEITDRPDFWGALVPGAYHLTLEGVPAHLRIRSFTAGSTNLIEQPFVVSSTGAAEPIRIELVQEPTN